MHDDRRSIFPSFLLDASVPKWRASNAMPGERDGHSQRAVVWRPRLFRNEHGALADATVKKAGDCKPCAEGTSGANVHCDGDRAWLSSLSDIKISIATAGNAVAQKRAFSSRPKADDLWSFVWPTAATSSLLSGTEIRAGTGAEMEGTTVASGAAGSSGPQVIPWTVVSPDLAVDVALGRCRLGALCRSPTTGRGPRPSPNPHCLPPLGNHACFRLGRHRPHWSPCPSQPTRRTTHRVA